MHAAMLSRQSGLHGGAAPRPAMATPLPSRRMVCTRATAPAQVSAQADPWKRIVEAEQKGEVLEVLVKSYNKGGLIVSVNELKGFVPYAQLSPEVLQKGHAGDMSPLIGKKMRARVLTVDMQSPRREIILSQKKAVLSEALRKLKVGDVVKGVVTGVEEYGVFVALEGGGSVTGLVHKSELSWERFNRVDEVVAKAQSVKVKVIDVDADKCRLNLSIKQTTPDPLKAGLDKLEWHATTSVPAPIQRLVEQLKAQPGVDDVVLTRAATDSHHVSQELQVLLMKGEVAGGYLVVARLGTSLQELQVNSSLPRDAFKELLAAAK